MSNKCPHCDKEDCGNHPWFFVARSYSHTDKRKLIKILTRRMKNKVDAEIWKEFEEGEDKKRKCPDYRRPRFFIIQTDHEGWRM